MLFSKYKNGFVLIVIFSLILYQSILSAGRHQRNRPGLSFAQSDPVVIWQPVPSPLKTERDKYGRVVNYRDDEGNIFMHIYNAGQMVNEYDQYVRFTNVGGKGEVEIQVRLHNGNTTIKEFTINHYFSSSECDTLVIGGQAQDSSTPAEYTMTFTSPNAVATDSSEAIFRVDSEYYNTITRATVRGEERNYFGPSQEIISDYAPSFVCAADLDNDGDMDLVSTHDYSKTINWHENIDRQGTFDNKKMIGDSIDINTKNWEEKPLCTTDFDSDGDTDILAVNVDDRIVWYENHNDASAFYQRILINDLTGDYSYKIFPSDMNGDGAVDVLLYLSELGFGTSEENIVWYENNGLGVLDSEHNVTEGSIRDIFPSDLDSDGDVDILACDHETDEIMWYENVDGKGNFTSAQHIPGLFREHAKDEPLVVLAADLNGDGHKEVLSSLEEGEKTIWYKNTGGGTFGEQQFFGLESGILRQPFWACDLDDDGDMDVLCGSWMLDGSYYLKWYENIDGNGVFGEHRLFNYVNGYNYDVCFADLDGDKDKDIIAIYTGSYFSAFEWFENLSSDREVGVINLSQPVPDQFQLEQNYPNPFNPSTTIEFSVSKTSPVCLKVYDLLGREISTLVDEIMTPGRYTAPFTVKDIPAGIYVYQIKMQGFQQSRKMTVLK
ncbi:T9SS type A sorting domain-containing protein [candidate division KSB1 bacterium]|nr:T9SS type A sorting domain-containing protein [candidate division KSB1 bacterium]